MVPTAYYQHQARHLEPGMEDRGTAVTVWVCGWCYGRDEDLAQSGGR